MEIVSIPGFTEPVSCWSHLLAAGAAAVSLVYLYWRGRGNGVRTASLVLYSVTLIFLFSMSGVYHLLDHGGEARSVLQRMDHAGIWALIAGTFTPIHIILFRSTWRWLPLVVVWTTAITGMVLEVVFFASFPEWLALLLFLALGWVGALTGFKFNRLFGRQSLNYLVWGGIFYSLGAVLDFAQWPVIIAGIVGPHEVFHLFVILGALFHWLFVYEWCDHPVTNIMTFKVRVFPESKYIAHALTERLKVEAESLEALKSNIREATAAKFHPTITPKIHLRYFEEEHL